jgi:hypothetical protein
MPNYPIQNEPTYPTVEYIKMFEKSELKQALEFARNYSVFYPHHRIVVENYNDAHGIAIAKNSRQLPDNDQVYLFIGGIRKAVLK